MERPELMEFLADVRAIILTTVLTVKKFWLINSNIWA